MNMTESPSKQIESSSETTESNDSPAKEEIPFGQSFNGASRVAFLESLESPFTLPQSENEAFQRRFSTIFINDEHTRSGGLGQVFLGCNSWGERFAIKVLSDDLLKSSDETDSQISFPSKSSEAFDQEYETLRMSSGIKGFPKLFAKGVLNGQPVIVMEWIEGETIERARKRLAIDDQNRLSPYVAAQIGFDLFDLLSRMDLLDEGLIHRDISPSNIMIATGSKSTEEQAESGSFELKLIDFGSAALSERESSLTERFASPRGATPDFASPEMLTEDAPNITGLRKSSAIDVYAAGSVLYLLLSGRAPFDLKATDPNGERLSPYRIKVEGSPSELKMAHDGDCDLDGLLSLEPKTKEALEAALGATEEAPSKEEIRGALCKVDDQLNEIVLACLSADQDVRPTAYQVREALSTFLNNYENNLQKALEKKELTPVSEKSLKRTSRKSSERATKIKFGLQGIVSFLGAAAIFACAILLNGLPAEVNVFGAYSEDAVNGLVIAAILLIPTILGVALRWNGTHTRAGFIRASAGVAIGTIAALISGSFISFTTIALGYFYIFAVLAAASCSWLFFVTDFVSQSEDRNAFSEAGSSSAKQEASKKAA